MTTPRIGCGRVVHHAAKSKDQVDRKIKKKGPGVDPPGPDLPSKWAGYFSEVEMLLKLVLSCVPTPCTAVMIAIAMPAAIRPYSMAVAPDSSLKNSEMSDFMAGSTSIWCAQNGGLPQFLCGTYGMEPKVALTEEIYFSGYWDMKLA